MNSPQSLKRKFNDTTPSDTEQYVNVKRVMHSLNSHQEYTTTTALPSPPQADDIMMIDDTSEEEESLQTTSNYYILTTMDDDLDEGGFTGQLERGWSDMFYDMDMYYQS